jgi:hypothetical protein
VRVNARQKPLWFGTLQKKAKKVINIFAYTSGKQNIYSFSMDVPHYPSTLPSTPLEQLSEVRASLHGLSSASASRVYLPLAPGLLAACTPDASRVFIPSALRCAQPSDSPAHWVPLDAALSFLTSHEATLLAREGEAAEAWASAQCQEGAVAARYAERAASKAALEKFLGVSSIEMRGENVVEVKDEGGESFLYITEFEEPGGSSSSSSSAATRAPSEPLPDPARELAIMKRLSYLELLEAGREAEWTDSEGREPLPPLPQRSTPALAAVGAAAKTPTILQLPAAASKPVREVQQAAAAAASAAATAAAAAAASAAATAAATLPLAPDHPPSTAGMSLFKQRMLASKRG